MAQQQTTPVNSKAPFTKQDEAKIVVMARAGHTPRVIAAHLGRTSSSISTKLWKMKNEGVNLNPIKKTESQVEKPRNKNMPWTEADDNALRKLASVGMNDVEIGDVLQRTRPAVSSRRYTLGIKNNTAVAAGMNKAKQARKPWWRKVLGL